MPRRFLPPSKQLMAKTRAGTALVSRDFYLDPPDLVAQKMLGKLLVRGDMVGRIVEVEAYFGEADAASHAFPARRQETLCSSDRRATPTSTSSTACIFA